MSHGRLKCPAVCPSLCLSVCLSYVSTLSRFFFFVSGVDRVPVLGIKKPVAQNVLQPSPRTPNFNVEVVGPREHTAQGEYKPVSAMAHVEALSTLKLWGAGGLARTQRLFMNRLLYSQHRNPISNRNKNDKLGEEEKGKPPTTQNTQSHSSCKVHLGGLLELVKIAQRRYNSFSIFRSCVQYILLRRVCKPPSPIES